MKWQRIEVTDPVFRTREQGRERDAWVWVKGEPMAVMRVMSPTVAYVKRLSGSEQFAVAMEPITTPFTALLTKHSILWGQHVHAY